MNNKKKKDRYDLGKEQSVDGYCLPWATKEWGLSGEGGRERGGGGMI